MPPVQQIVHNGLLVRPDPSGAASYLHVSGRGEVEVVAHRQPAPGARAVQSRASTLHPDHGMTFQTAASGFFHDANLGSFNAFA